MENLLFPKDKGRRKPPLLKPLEQGNLDGLCGIYSIINAARYLCRKIKREESFALFHFLIKQANKCGNLKEIITQGLTHKQFKHLLKFTIKWLKCEHGIKLKAKRYKANNLTLKSTWSDFEKRLEQDAVILIGFSGKQNHYSMITAISPKRLMLFDSSKIHLIRKSQCAIKYYEDKYCIEPKEVFFLKRKT